MLLLSIGLFSCSNESKIKESITNKIKEHLKNPDSFEFVSMKVKKTESLKDLKKRFTIKDLKQLIKDYKELDKGYEDGQNHDDLVFVLENYLKFLEKNIDEKKDAIYYVDFVSKGTNSYGAIIQSNYEAQVLNDDNKTTLYTTELEK